ELEPVSLLARLAPSFYGLPRGVNVIYDATHYAHAYSFTTRAAGLHFLASDIVKFCNYFPEEFSLLITLKTSNTTSEQCIMTLMPRASTEVKIGVTMSLNVIRVTYASEKVISVDFDDMDAVFDGQWHSLVVSVTGDTVSVRVDCRHSVSRRLRRHFPAFVDAGNDEIHIGNCNGERGLFTGWLKDVILLPGSDISLATCPSVTSLTSAHSNAHSNGIEDTYRECVVVSAKCVMFPFCVEFSDAHCGWQDTGKMTFDLSQNNIQQSILESVPRMDYITWHQDIITAAPVVDLEIFRIPGEGLFMATASYDRLLPNKQQSAIFRWHQGRFKVFQSLYSLGAQAWEFFTIDKKYFLAVANLGARRDQASKSTIFRWSGKRKKFRQFQELITWNARDIEHLEVNGRHYLAVANHVQENQNHIIISISYSIDSMLFVWDSSSRAFKPSQNMSTDGAMDFTHFRVEQYDFLVVANFFIGKSSSFSAVNSVVHLWQNSRFLPFQSLSTTGATDFEAFSIDDDYFVAVANSDDFGLSTLDSVAERYQVNSTIYRLNKIIKQFEVYQQIETQSIRDWEHFRVGDDHYLIASNSRRGLSSSAGSSSVIYRWQGVEKFVEKHRLDSLPSSDWETFTENGETFLVYANAENSISQVYKVK
ncbi:hypothetical protein CAPTEDRAFT_42858, partial [Capitella teleta]